MSRDAKGRGWCAAAAAAKLRWAAGRIAAQAYVTGQDQHNRRAARLALLARAIAENAPACCCGGAVAHLPERRRTSV